MNATEEPKSQKPISPHAAGEGRLTTPRRRPGIQVPLPRCAACTPSTAGRPFLIHSLRSQQNSRGFTRITRIRSDRPMHDAAALLGSSRSGHCMDAGASNSVGSLGFSRIAWIRSMHNAAAFLGSSQSAHCMECTARQRPSDRRGALTGWRPEPQITRITWIAWVVWITRIQSDRLDRLDRLDHSDHSDSVGLPGVPQAFSRKDPHETQNLKISKCSSTFCAYCASLRQLSPWSPAPRVGRRTGPSLCGSPSSHGSPDRRSSSAIPGRCSGFCRRDLPASRSRS